MLAVPRALLDVLDLQPGTAVDVSIEGGRLIVEKQAKPHYTLAELLAASDYSQTRHDDDRAWIDGAAIGRELL